jgi:hypothetical protein
MKPERYNERFPNRPPLTTSKDGLVAGTWLIGACYKNPNPLYGAYPHGYLERVHSMFPEARNVLHVFSGGLDVHTAWEAAEFGDYREDASIELVDLHGPEEGRAPTWQGDLFDMPTAWHARFDLILADPPYSADDAEKYATPMINRARVTSHLRAFAKTGGHMVWLDQVWPMHSKKRWKTVGQVGLVRSTNHRVRLVTFFEAV